MLGSPDFHDALRTRNVFILLVALFLLASSATVIHAQGAIDYTGTGGKHTIEGRLYFSSGRKADAPGLKVTLENAGGTSLILFSDSNGSFSFRNLGAGSYTIVIEATEDYEGTRESVYIDDPGSTNIRTSSLSVGTAARTFIVPIYLIPKRSNAPRPGVIDATLVDVPKPALDLYYQAMASKAVDPQKAITQLEAAISIYPKFPRALNELGVQYLKIRQVQKAVLTLQSAVRLAPDEFIPRLNYGIALLESKNFAEAETELRLVLQKNDNVATAHMYLGIVLIHKRRPAGSEDNSRYVEAEQQFQRAIALGGDQVVQAHYYLAGIYWRNGDHRRAADELETYLKLAPNAPDADRTRATIKELRAKA